MFRQGFAKGFWQGFAKGFQQGFDKGLRGIAEGFRGILKILAGFTGCLGECVKSFGKLSGEVLVVFGECSGSFVELSEGCVVAFGGLSRIYVELSHGVFTIFGAGLGCFDERSEAKS